MVTTFLYLTEHMIMKYLYFTHTFNMYLPCVEQIKKQVLDNCFTLCSFDGGWAPHQGAEEPGHRVVPGGDRWRRPSPLRHLWLPAVPRLDSLRRGDGGGC